MPRCPCTSPLPCRPSSHALPPCAAAAYTCDATTCTPPSCLCGSTKTPGGLAPAKTPQFVLITVGGRLHRHACAVPHPECLMLPAKGGLAGQQPTRRLFCADDHGRNRRTVLRPGF